MKRTRVAWKQWTLALVASWLVWSQPGQAETPGSRPAHTPLPEISRRLAVFVTNHTIAGAVTLVARDGKVTSLDTVGYADLDSGRRMKRDSLFWIASMTKPITAVAVLQLQDAGKLSIDDPVERFLPEFRNQWLVGERAEGKLVLKRPARPVTLRDLLTHTSGLGDVESPRPEASLAELVMAYSREPLRFEPGSQWQYCNSGINTLGRVVEVVSGKSFAHYLETHLFRPLGMNNTTFWPSPGQLKRLAKTYQPSESGQGLEAIAIVFLKGNLASRKRTPFPSGGLFSTAEDQCRFYQMMLDGGLARGRRVLSSSAVALMTRTQTGDLRTGFTDGMSFGLGFAVVKAPQGPTAMLSAGTFGHGGAYGTQSWADPVKRLICILMIQRAKLPNADASEVRRVFQEWAVSSLSGRDS